MRRLLSFLMLVLFVGLSALPLQAQTFRTPPPSSPALTGFGGALAVGDGLVFVGEPQNRFRPGIVYVYAQEADAWTERVRLTASDAVAGDHFGQALAVEGNTLLVSATQQDSARGAVYVFAREGDTWSQMARLTAPDDAPQADFGASLGLRGDVAVVGAPAREEGIGAAYVFTRDDAGAWSYTTTLAAADTTAQTTFGASLAAGDDVIMVGAPGHNQRTGIVYVYDRDDAGSWTELATLTGSSVEQNDRFGSSLEIDGDLALVGAPRHGQNVGAVFAFQRDTTLARWNEKVRLLPFDGAQQHRFGAALSFVDGAAWIGAPGANRFEGTVYRYEHTKDERADAEGRWTGARQLTPQVQNTRDFFGGTVAAEGDLAAVGISGADYGAGSVVIFERDARGDWTQQALLESEPDALPAVTGQKVDCSEGEASPFDCQKVDLLSFLPIQDIGGGRGVRLNDIWGWTDPQTGAEWALVGRVDGTSFVDISDPSNPRYVGDLPKTEGSPGSSWRDIKVYQDHAFIVSDNAGDHGMQIFDLAQLRDVENAPVTFDTTAHYDQIASAHNVVINEETGFAYIVGAGGGGETCGGGLHMVNIQNPTEPSFAGCFADPSTGRKGTGYSHDAQCIVYEGPDEEHQGSEICFGSNETALSIADVSDKENPVALAVAEYPNTAYTHQGWISDDHRYFYVNDELDELSGKVEQTRALIWDVTDLDDPQLVREYTWGPTATDHNLYVRGDMLYMSNYASGLRVHDISDPANPAEVGYFDTTPVGDNGPGFSGTWSNYPFFKSGVVAVSSIGEGLFLVKPSKEAGI